MTLPSRVLVPIDQSGSFIAAQNGTPVSVSGSGLFGLGVDQNGYARLLSVIQSGSFGILQVTGTILAVPTGTQQITGSLICNQGTPNSLSNAWTMKLTDGVNSPTIKPANITPISNDTAFVTAFAPYAPLPSGSNKLGSVFGPDAVDSPPANNPQYVAGRDISGNVKYFLLDLNGRTLVVGAAANGSASIGNPVLFAGTDNNNLTRTIKTDNSGTVQINQIEKATFSVLVTGSSIGNGKSMISITNATGSNVDLKIHEIGIINIQTNTVAGIVAEFQLKKITGHSSGTDLVVGAGGFVTSHDSYDGLSSNITMRTGATVSGEGNNIYNRWFWSTDEWGPGTLDQEGYDHGLQSSIPAFSKILKTKPITLHAGEGITLKQITNSTIGTFDIYLMVTQE